MKTQHYGNHKQFVPGYHFFLVPLVLFTFIAAVVYTGYVYINGGALFSAVLLMLCAGTGMVAVFFLRYFACKAQDRAIRAEESLRHYILTGKPLDSRLTMKQVIALRFASDEEFPSLCDKAVSESQSPDAIKRSIQHWKADHDRV